MPAPVLISPRTVVPKSSSAREWLRRYGPAEAVGIVTAILGSWSVHAWTGNEIAAAYGGSLGENVGFYGVMIGREIRNDRLARHVAGNRYGLRQWAGTALKLLTEFGGAELLDSFLLRPLAMGTATRFLGRELGVVAGKLMADVTFYVPVILAYEMRRRAGRGTG